MSISPLETGDLSHRVVTTSHPGPPCPGLLCNRKTWQQAESWGGFLPLPGASLPGVLEEPNPCSHLSPAPQLAAIDGGPTGAAEAVLRVRVQSGSVTLGVWLNVNTNALDNNIPALSFLIKWLSGLTQQLFSGNSHKFLACWEDAVNGASGLTLTKCHLVGEKKTEFANETLTFGIC